MRKICITIVLYQIVFFGSCQMKKLTDPEIVIPMDMTSHRPIVELTIDGKGPYKFIFDTGSSTNVLDKKLSQEFGFKVIGEDSLKTQGTSNRLISQRVSVPNVHFPGTDISKDVEMNVVDLRAMLPIDGVLSGIFFDEYLVTMDYPSSILILTIGELDKNDDDVTAIIENPRVLSYNLDVGGNIIEAHLDTGSPGGFSLPYSMKDQLTFKEELREGGEIRTPVATYKPWHARIAGNIKLGNVTYENPEVVLVEAFEYANLGYAVVKDLRTTIDRKNNLIKFEKPSSGIPQIKTVVNASRVSNEYIGWYGRKVRQVVVEDGELYLKRGQSKLKLVPIKKNLYKMVYHTPVNNELPNVRFERDEVDKVNGLTFIFKDGREDFVKKD